MWFPLLFRGVPRHPLEPLWGPPGVPWDAPGRALPGLGCTSGAPLGVSGVHSGGPRGSEGFLLTSIGQKSLCALQIHPEGIAQLNISFALGGAFAAFAANECSPLMGTDICLNWGALSYLRICY